MARGQSGRIVLEIDPSLKRAVHARLAADGITMKSWFLEQVEELLNSRQQELPLSGSRAIAEPMLAADRNGSTYVRGSR